MMIIMKKRPRKLYKYRSLAGDDFRYTMQIFTDSFVKYTRPIDFNDPFESCFLVSFEASFEKQYSFIKNVIINSKYDQAYKDSQLLGLNKETVAQTIDLMNKQENRRISNSIREKQLVFSLSEVYNEIVMWSHYADSHRGICIEFDSECLDFGRDTFLEYVDYSDSYPCIYPIESDGKLNAAITEKILFHKFKRWEYEQEWRYVLPNDGVEVKRFPSNALTGVILGHAIHPINRDHVRKWAKDRNIPVMQTKTKDDAYELDFKILPPDAIYKSHDESWATLSVEYNPLSIF